MTERMTFGTVLGRSLRLRCPSCGGDRVFLGLLRVKERCGACGFNCRPEGGYYIGAIYINYALTAAIALAIATPFAYAEKLVAGVLVAGSVAVIFAVSCFQLSRSLWLGIDYWITRR